MPQLHALNAKRHAGWNWTPRSGAAFAAQRWLSPVVIAELGQVVARFPVVFQRSQDGRLGAAALFSLQPEHNAFVDAQGRWRAQYMPAFLRTHPFQLAVNPKKGYVVMLDEASPVVDAHGNTGQRILTPEGEPAEPVNDIVNFLKRYAAQQHLTDKACRALDEHRLLATLSDLDAQAATDDSAKPGLYRISQPALDALDPERLAKLRDVGALSLAYAQLLSMPRLHALQRMQRDAAAVEELGSLEELFGEGTGGEFTFDFDR